MTGVPAHFTVPVKACGCGVLLGEVCDCPPGAAAANRLADTAPRSAFPKPLILRLVGGLLRPVEDAS